MKLLHLADLHLGKRVNGFSMLEDQRYILDRILDIADAETPQAVLIAGDVYDRAVPPEEAMDLFDSFLVGLARRGIQVYIISGNHDSAGRVAFGGRLMDASGIHFAPVYSGTITPLTLSDEYGPVSFYLIPFLKPAQVRRFWPDVDPEGGTATYTDAVRTVIAHLDPAPAGRCVALAHQFEANQKKSVTVVELGPDSAAVRLVPLVPQRDVRRIRGLFDDITDPAFLANQNTGDYCEITLLDEEDVPSAQARLRAVWPHLMTLRYDNTRTRSEAQVTASAAVESKTPLELLDELYDLQNGQPMNGAQRALAARLIEEIWEETP